MFLIHFYIKFSFFSKQFDVEAARKRTATHRKRSKDVLFDIYRDPLSNEVCFLSFVKRRKYLKNLLLEQAVLAFEPVSALLDRAHKLLQLFPNNDLLIRLTRIAV